MSPPLSDLVRVVHGSGEYSTKLISLVDIAPGGTLTKIEGAAPTTTRAYTSVQVSEDKDIELNSDLVYCNHSCDPSVEFDMATWQVRVVPGRALKKGQDITFFYPSTEWDMKQPFDCDCGTGRCLGSVQGAKYLDDATLKGYWLNPHIERLVQRRGSP